MSLQMGLYKDVTQNKNGRIEYGFYLVTNFFPSYFLLNYSFFYRSFWTFMWPSQNIGLGLSK